jgi:PhnB protein
MRPDQTPKSGNMVCLYLESSSTELKNLFTKLSEGANVTDPLKEEFHGTYGALNDRFGIRWMFHSNNS